MGDHLDERLVELHEEWRPLEAIRLIHKELGLPLHQAKQYLHDHAAWRADLGKSDEIVDRLESEFVDPP